MKQGKTITTWQGACIIAGYGVGGTIMTMPYLAKDVGLVNSLIMLAVCYVLSILTALYTADTTLKTRKVTGGDCQVLKQFETFLFTGKNKNGLTILYFGLMLIISVSSLAAYVSEGGVLVSSVLPVTEKIGSVLFYIVAASVVLLGLKGVAIGERAMVIVMMTIMAVFAILSHGRSSGLPVPSQMVSFIHGLRYVGYLFMALTAPLSIPQVVDGLDGDGKAVKKAVWLGFGLNALTIAVVVIFTTLTASEIGEVAMVSWTAALPGWTKMVGVLYIIIALLTSFWSIALAMQDIVAQQFRLNSRLCWLIATAPSLLIALFTSASFIDLLGLAGGALGIVNGIMFIPLYICAKRRVEETIMGPFAAIHWVLFDCAVCIVYAIGCVV